jgi:hypothetical protein
VGDVRAGGALVINARGPVHADAAFAKYAERGAYHWWRKKAGPQPQQESTPEQVTKWQSL